MYTFYRKKIHISFSVISCFKDSRGASGFIFSACFFTWGELFVIHQRVKKVCVFFLPNKCDRRSDFCPQTPFTRNLLFWFLRRHYYEITIYQIPNFATDIEFCLLLEISCNWNLLIQLPVTSAECNVDPIIALHPAENLEKALFQTIFNEKLKVSSRSFHDKWKARKVVFFR